MPSINTSNSKNIIIIILKCVFKNDSIVCLFMFLHAKLTYNKKGGILLPLRLYDRVFSLYDTVNYH